MWLVVVYQVLLFVLGANDVMLLLTFTWYVPAVAYVCDKALMLPLVLATAPSPQSTYIADAEEYLPAVYMPVFLYEAVACAIYSVQSAAIDTFSHCAYRIVFDSSTTLDESTCWPPVGRVNQPLKMCCVRVVVGNVLYVWPSVYFYGSQLEPPAVSNLTVAVKS